MFKVLNKYTNQIETIYGIRESDLGMFFIIYDKDKGWTYKSSENYKPII